MLLGSQKNQPRGKKEWYFCLMKISKKGAAILRVVLQITSGFFAYALNPMNQIGVMDHGSH